MLPFQAYDALDEIGVLDPSGVRASTSRPTARAPRVDLGAAAGGGGDPARGARDPVGARAGATCSATATAWSAPACGRPTGSATTPPTSWSAPTAPGRGCASWRASPPTCGWRHGVRVVPQPRPRARAVLDRVPQRRPPGDAARLGRGKRGRLADRPRPGRRRGGARAGDRRVPRGVPRLLPQGADVLAPLTDDDLSYREVTEVRCEEWWRPGVALIGEALHAMNPEVGIGSGLGMGDAQALAIAVAQNPDDRTPRAAGTSTGGAPPSRHTSRSAVPRRRSTPRRARRPSTAGGAARGLATPWRWGIAGSSPGDGRRRSRRPERRGRRAGTWRWTGASGPPRGRLGTPATLWPASHGIVTREDAPAWSHRVIFGAGRRPSGVRRSAGRRRPSRRDEDGGDHVLHLLVALVERQEPDPDHAAGGAAAGGADLQDLRLQPDPVARDERPPAEVLHPRPIIPPATRGPCSTDMRMVSAAACHPLPTWRPNTELAPAPGRCGSAAGRTRGRNATISASVGLPLRGDEPIARMEVLEVVHGSGCCHETAGRLVPPEGCSERRHREDLYRRSDGRTRPAAPSPARRAWARGDGNDPQRVEAAARTRPRRAAGGGDALDPESVARPSPRPSPR